ncbi:hypothetical protein RFI_02661 [Reticulomyxa filosa]|uniref:Uncharacterized protein n=1 Tax=Reticulomyxa filosa TaxID=46433 RepID=X6P8J9_RETFI|nr:hypothetical protein RFI_02661 [Reticulomyxa filosa]|eukprot:ETO34433.1 hypothetical protein RFI_02661 [Reticulomyxa filosa]
MLAEITTILFFLFSTELTVCQVLLYLYRSFVTPNNITIKKHIICTTEFFLSKIPQTEIKKKCNYNFTYPANRTYFIFFQIKRNKTSSFQHFQHLIIKNLIIFLNLIIYSYFYISNLYFNVLFICPDLLLSNNDVIEILFKIEYYNIFVFIIFHLKMYVKKNCKISIDFNISPKQKKENYGIALVKVIWKPQT